MLYSKPIKKCVKCGALSEDKSRTLHCFPLPTKNNIERARKWAQWAYPEENWDSVESLMIQYKKTQKVCSVHFNRNRDFTANNQLNSCAIPSDTPYGIEGPELSLDPSLSDPNHSLELPQCSSGCPGSTPFTLGILEPEVCMSTGDSHPQPTDPNNTKVSDYTPEEQELFKTCRRVKKEIKRILKTIKEVDKDKYMQTLENDPELREVYQQMLPYPFALQRSLRRVSKEEWPLIVKRLALTVAKKSPAAYRFLREVFSLPSRPRLRRLLESFPFETGINRKVLAALKRSIRSRFDNEEDMLCVLMFSQMRIKPNVSYNAGLDLIEGFMDHGRHGRLNEIANFALVFMVRGIYLKWKQPVAYYFSSYPASPTRVAQLIPEVINSLSSIKLKVVATVCEMEAGYDDALDILRPNNGSCCIKVGGVEIPTVFDPSRLLISTRNEFMENNIRCEKDLSVFTKDGGGRYGVAKWEHLKEVYRKKNKLKCWKKRIPELSALHLNPELEELRRPILAAQVFDVAVGNGLLLYSYESKKPEFGDTASFLIEMNALYDSLSGSWKRDIHTLKGPLTNKSQHLDYWEVEKARIKKWQFSQREPLPFQKGWLISIEAMKHVWKTLPKLHYSSVEPKAFNQDPLENFFSVIRGLSGGKDSPSVEQFVSALKTAILNGVVYYDWETMSGEADKIKFLSNLRRLLTSSTLNTVKPTDEEIRHGDMAFHKFCKFVKRELVESLKLRRKGSRNLYSLSTVYVAGFIVRKMTSVKVCDICRTILISDPNLNPCNEFIVFRKYSASNLYPSENMIISVGSGATIVENYLNTSAYLRRVKDSITVLFEVIDFDWLKICSKHFEHNRKFILNLIFWIWIRWWCKNINRRLKS